MATRKKRDIARKLGKLKAAFIAEMNMPLPPRFLDDKWPECPELTAWMGRKIDHKNRFDFKHHWKRLRAGDAYPWHAFEILAGYLTDKKWPILAGHPITAESIAEPTDEEPEKGPKDDIWKIDDGWANLMPRREELIGLPPGAICQSNAEVSEAARIIVECAGRKSLPNGSTLSVEDALRQGTKVMRRSRWEVYADWLCHLHSAVSNHVVLFAMAPDVSGAMRRVGATVVIPLKESSFCNVRSGLKHDRDLEPDDCCTPSLHLFVNAVADIPLSDYRNVRQRSLAQMRCILFQMASLCPPIGFPTQHIPSFIGLAPPEHVNAERGGNFGFVPTTNCLPGTNIRISELTAQSIDVFPMTCTFLMLYQMLFNHRQ